MELDRYLSANQVCALLHITRRTLTAWIQAGLPVHQIVPRGRLFFDSDEVDAWIMSRCTSTAPDNGEAAS
jgi:predicted DNA-binding transcriptional regulator AlpA